MTSPHDDGTAARARAARVQLGELRAGDGRPFYSAEDLANLSDADALLDADAYDLPVEKG